MQDHLHIGQIQPTIATPLAVSVIPQFYSNLTTRLISVYPILDCQQRAASFLSREKNIHTRVTDETHESDTRVWIVH